MDLNRPSYSAILWTDAGTVAGLHSGYLAFAEAARVAVQGDAEASLGNVKRWLENHEGWLMVLDNLDLGEGGALLEELDRRLPKVMRGHLLVATRHPSLAELGRFRDIEMPPFPPDVAVLFLKRRTRRETVWGRQEDEAARALVALANCWPSVEYGVWPLCRLLLPHSLHLWATVPAGTWEDQPSSLRLLNQCGSFLDAQGRYAEAEPLEGLERRLGRNHPHTATVRGNLERLRRRKLCGLPGRLILFVRGSLERLRRRKG